MSSTGKGGKTGKDRGAAVNFSILLTDADEDDALGRVSFGMAGYTCSSGLWTKKNKASQYQSLTSSSGHNHSSYFFCLN